MKAYRRGGDGALAGRDPTGRPRKLTARQERQVLRWFDQSPTKFGFPTELWTAGRVAQVIHRKWHIKFHPHYLSQWLAERRITPQKPRFQAREHDEDEVQRWLREDWPRIKKVRSGGMRTSF
jgi:transposase